MIVRFVKDRLHVVAVFEVKSGAKAAKGLVLKSRPLSEATKEQRLALQLSHNQLLTAR
jgi:hypothetical protein